MKKLVISVTVLVVLAIIVLAVLRARASREVILKTNGVPLANLKGSIMAPGLVKSVPTSTDPDGRLDLRGVPRGAEYIRLELWGHGDNVRVLSTLVVLPASGSRMVVNVCGSRTVCTTTTTYADFVWFKLTAQKVETCEQAQRPSATDTKENEPSRDNGVDRDNSPSN